MKLRELATNGPYSLLQSRSTSSLCSARGASKRSREASLWPACIGSPPASLHPWCDGRQSSGSRPFRTSTRPMPRAWEGYCRGFSRAAGRPADRQAAADVLLFLLARANDRHQGAARLALAANRALPAV